MTNSSKRIKRSLMIAISLFILSGSSYAQKNIKQDVRSLKGIDYQSEPIDINKVADSKTYKDGMVTITEIMDEYLFPRGIDPSGKHITIQTFGTAEESFYWSAETGIVSFVGNGNDITTEGIISGDFFNSNFPGGGSARTAGTYSLENNEWSFLGINPAYPTITAEDYNSAWGQSDDGSWIVGLQLYDGWSATAFKWTAEEGYTNIGSDFQYDSRASGISRNGETIFGWASVASGYWTPVAWHDGTATEISPGGSGEAMCASPEGTYVAGLMDNNAFIWSAEEGMIPFGSWEDYPTIVMEDGSAFGFTGVFPPPVRRAFYKTPEGEMLTFNDYAESRGMDNAQEWTFYSVNNVTPDGNKFIGAAINPQGQDICFLIDFSEPSQTYELNLVASPEEGGLVIGSGEYVAGAEVNISANANPVWAFENWTDEEGTIISEDAETTFIMPEEVVILYANFKSTVGIESINNIDFDIKPNPATNIISIQNTLSGRLRIFNIQGREVFKKLITSNETIDISGLKKGAYILSFETLNTSQKGVFIKQ